MDVGCGFKVTVSKSSLASRVAEKGIAFLVNAFHGYSHNFLCQLRNHPSIFKGVGLEDFETLERIFSASNALASIIRFASPYRRRLLIDAYFRQWDDDKYANLGTFILHNYIQALDGIENDSRNLAESMTSYNITHADMDQWEKEQAEFFGDLGKEPEATSLQVEYVELLQELQVACTEKMNAESTFYRSLPESVIIQETPGSTRNHYAQSAAATLKLETRRRLAREKCDRLLHDVIELEATLGITQRWIPSDPQYIETKKYVAERTYHRAVDRVNEVVIKRLFELHKLNIAGTGEFKPVLLTASCNLTQPLSGYKMRTQLTKALQKRCKTIRRAVADYNKAALALDPPREPLEYTTVSHYAFIEEFAFLKDTRNDIRDKPWAKPLYREMLKLRHRIARAKEEILRCNVETCRLHTAISDENLLFSRVLARLKAVDDPLLGPAHDFITRRRAVNAALMKRIKQIHSLPEFSGNKTRGVSVNAVQLPSSLSNEPETSSSPPRNDGTESDSDIDEDDDEFRHAVVGVETFVVGLSR